MAGNLNGDDLYDESYVDRGDEAFYKECAAKYRAPILELGCGTGRIMLALAEMGHQVTGIDLNQRRIEICQQRISEQDNNCRFLRRA